MARLRDREAPEGAVTEERDLFALLRPNVGYSDRSRERSWWERHAPELSDDHAPETEAERAERWRLESILEAKGWTDADETTDEHARLLAIAMGRRRRRDADRLTFLVDGGWLGGQALQTAIRMLERHAERERRRHAQGAVD